MTRLLLACVMVVAVGSSAEAGEKCRQRPEVLFWNQAADVHEDGRWHRTRKGVETSGRLSFEALDRFKAFRQTGEKTTKVLRCLDALIKDEGGRTAARACKVPKA